MRLLLVRLQLCLVYALQLTHVGVLLSILSTF